MIFQSVLFNSSMRRGSSGILQLFLACIQYTGYSIWFSKKKLIANSTSQWLILIVSGKTDPFPGQEMVNPPHKNSSENYQSITDPFSGIRIMWVHLSSSKHCDREAVGIHCPGAHVMEELVHWKHVFNKSTFIFKIQCDMGSIVWHLIFVNWSMLTDKK